MTTFYLGQVENEIENMVHEGVLDADLPDWYEIKLFKNIVHFQQILHGKSKSRKSVKKRLNLEYRVRIGIKESIEFSSLIKFSARLLRNVFT